MEYLQEIDTNNKIILTGNRNRAYVIEYAGNARLLCRLLQIVYPGTDFNVEPEEMEGRTGMHIISCSSRQLGYTKIKQFFKLIFTMILNTIIVGTVFYLSFAAYYRDFLWFKK